MNKRLKSFLYPFLTGTFGNILVFLRPEKARQLSEDRILLVFKNKDNLSIQEQLMRGALVRKLEKIKDYKSIADSNHDFWVTKAPKLFLETEQLFNTHFLKNCTFIFDLLKKELSNHSEKFNTLVEIGTGNGSVLNYLSSEFPEINRFVGIDLSSDQTELNNKKYINNKKLEFVAADAFDWIKANGQTNTIFVTRDTLEYFLEPNLQELFNDIQRLGKIIFVAIEPNGSDHNFETHPSSQLYGNEPSFSHNYPKLIKNAGFTVWHFSRKSSYGVDNSQSFIGAIN